MTYYTRSVRTALLAGLVTLVLAAGVAGGIDSRWTAAAAKLDMPVLAPTQTFGMTLKRIHARGIDCGPITEELEAYYGAGEARKLTILEGKPAYCGDIGDAPVLGTPRVHGKKATLYGYCQGTGCKHATFKYALLWREHGVQVSLLSRGLPRPKLLRLAASMEVVPG